MVNRVAVAVLSALHGVLPAVAAVLAEPEVSGADLIVLTGDLACGPRPAALLDLPTGLGDRAARIRATRSSPRA